MIKTLVCYVWNVPGGPTNYTHNFCSIAEFTEKNLLQLRDALTLALEEGEAIKQACLTHEQSRKVNLVFTNVIRLDG